MVLQRSSTSKHKQHLNTTKHEVSLPPTSNQSGHYSRTIYCRHPCLAPWHSSQGAGTPHHVHDHLTAWGVPLQSGLWSLRITRERQQPQHRAARASLHRRPGTADPCVQTLRGPPVWTYFISRIPGMDLFHFADPRYGPISWTPPSKETATHSNHAIHLLHADNSFVRPPSSCVKLTTSQPPSGSRLLSCIETTGDDLWSGWERRTCTTTWTTRSCE